MAVQGATLFDKKFIGDPVLIGTSRDRYDGLLMAGEVVRMEFKGIRDAMLFTDLRMVVIDPQGIRGKKVAIASIPWKSISAFSVENSGTFDLDAELKVCGSGFGVCEVMFTKGTDVEGVNAFITEKVFGFDSFASAGLTNGAASAEGVPEDESVFTVVLKTCPKGFSQRAKLEVALRKVTETGPAEARKLLKQLPRSVKEGLSKDEAEQVGAYLVSQGAEIQIERSG